MQLANLPIKITTPWAANAGSAYIRAIPNQSQIGRVNGAASWADGFPPLNFIAVAAGGIPPFGADANGALNQMSSWDRWYQAGGPVNYDATFQAAIGGYPRGATIGSPVTPYMLWQSIVDNNLTNPDTPAGTNWQLPLFPDPSITGQSPPKVALTIKAANPTAANSNGAGLALQGSGTVTPNKYLRALAGRFAVINNAYTAEIFTLDDTGDVTNVRNITATGAGSFSGALSADSGAFTHAVTAASAALTGALTAASASLTGALQANSASITTSMTADTVTAKTSVTIGGAAASNWLFNVASNGNRQVHYFGTGGWYDEFETSTGNRYWWGDEGSGGFQKIMTLGSDGSIYTRLNGTIGGGLAVGQNITALNSLTFTGSRQTAFFGTSEPAGAVRFIGTSPNFHQLGVEGYNNSLVYNTPNKPFGGGAMSIDSNGDVVFAGSCTATAFPTGSDANLKTNIEAWTKGLTEIMQIETVSFEYLDDDKGTKHHGVTAQQVQTVLPEAVMTLNRYQTLQEINAGNPPDTLLAVEHSTIFFAALNAIKELATRVYALEGGGDSDALA